MNRKAAAGLSSALAVWVVLLLGCSESETELTVLPPSGLAAEVRAALAESSYLDRNERLASALRQLTAENVDAVVEVYSEVLKDLEPAEMEPLFDAWTRFDAPAAFAYALDIPHPEVMPTSLKAVMYAWATRDALAASVAAEQGAKKRPRKALLFYQGLIEGWAISGQDGLQEFILEGPSASDPAQLLQAAQPNIYLREGVEGLLEWSESMIKNASEYTTRMQAFRYTVRTVGYRDPRAAIPFVMRHYGEEYATEGPRVLVEKWMHRDPEAALAWTRTEAPEETREVALGMATGSWLIRDRIAARAWIDSLPVGDPYYQPAFDKVAVRLARHDPNEAVDWCHRGQAPELNSTCLRQVAITWYRIDPVAAELWLEEESKLSVEDRQAVRKRATPKKNQQKKGKRKP